MIAAALPELPPFEDVYREYLPRIGSFLRAQLGNSTEAEDVTAQVFARAFEAYARFEPRCSTPSAWRIDPCQLAETRLWAGSVRRAVATLPERQREVISLRHRFGLTFKEAGARLHCSEDAAKMLYHRGLRALRPMLTEGVAA
jgi:DNA-directed RNA polymerase specialized sigma24 family protein